MGLKLLHLSDIHFRNFQNHKFLDLDKDIQRELEIDLAELKSEYNKIDIILIGGDIAYSGKVEEYEAADKWIKKICSITGCDEENVLTVPGNHDIDRDRVNAIVKDVHQKFKESPDRNAIDKKITDYFLNADSLSVLLSPLINYNSFAQKYGSLPQGDNPLFWEKDFCLDNSILRIRGVNSALVSDERDDELNSKLVIGSHQSNMIRNERVIYIVLCHHPPDWIIDGEHAHNDFKARAKIHLFGHKHKFGAELVENQYLVLAAGAMQPSRAESDWEPRYNIIELNIPTVAKNHILNVKLYKRLWDKQNKKFSADIMKTGGIFEDYNLILSNFEVSTNSLSKQEEVTELKVVPMAEPIIDLNVPNPKRKLAYMFLGLPYHVKLKIALSLGLIEDADRDLGEIQKSQAYFQRASEKMLLDALWDQVTKTLGIYSSNPFSN